MSIQDLTANLDLKQNLNIYATCKQLDNLNLILSIYDNSVQANLTNYNIRLKAMKADNIPLIQEHTGITPLGNVITIVADEQLTTTSGKTLIELEFINTTTGLKKATFNLVLQVVPSIVAINATISTATYTLLEELENKLDQAGDFLENITDAVDANTALITSIASATTSKTNLDSSISTAGTTKTALDTSNTTANTTKTALNTSITNANTSKTAIDLSKTNADASKVALDTSITSANTFVTNHGNIIDLDNRVTQNTASLSEKAKQTDLDTTNTNLSQLSKPSSLINGDFQVWQRGTSLLINTVSNTYVTDRWYATLGQITSGSLAVAKNTVQKENDSNYCVEINCNSLVTTGAVLLTQLLETTEVVKLRGKQVTFSVYLKVLSGSADCKLRIQDGTDTNTYPATNSTTDDSTANVTTTWQRFTLTHTVQANANSLVVRIVTPNAFQGILYVSRAKIEIGDKATPFVPRFFGEELALCKKYFQRFNTQSIAYPSLGIVACGSTVNAYMSIPLAGVMRLKPTAILKGNLIIANTSVTISALSSDTLTENFIKVSVILSAVLSNGLYMCQGNNDATSDIWLDAEL